MVNGWHFPASSHQMNPCLAEPFAPNMPVASGTQAYVATTQCDQAPSHGVPVLAHYGFQVRVQVNKNRSQGGYVLCIQRRTTRNPNGPTRTVYSMRALLRWAQGFRAGLQGLLRHSGGGSASVQGSCIPSLRHVSDGPPPFVVDELEKCTAGSIPCPDPAHQPGQGWPTLQATAPHDRPSRAGRCE